jgi:nitroreductase
MLDKRRISDDPLAIDHPYPESRPLARVIPHRRDTTSFSPTPVPDELLLDVLELGLLAPSGYNLQPWRFVVARDPEVRKRLRAAAMDQKQVEEAPVVIAACGDPGAWRRSDLEEMIELGRGFHAVNDEDAEALRKNATAYLESYPADMWVTRQVSIAFTHLMLAAEAYGLNTGPMEGFDEGKVREVLGIPSEVRVIALLALGHRKGDEKPYGGRFSLRKTVHWDRYGG